MDVWRVLSGWNDEAADPGPRLKKKLRNPLDW
jgi:hypothetical protein